MSGFQKTPTNPHQEKKIPVDRTMRWSSLIANLQPFCLKSRSCAPKRRRSWFWDPWVFSRVLNDGRTSGAKISRWDTDGYRDEFVLFVMFIHPMADYLRIICIHNYTTYNYICIYFYIQHVTCLYMFVMVSVHIYIYIFDICHCNSRTTCQPTPNIWKNRTVQPVDRSWSAASAMRCWPMGCWEAKRSMSWLLGKIFGWDGNDGLRIKMTSQILEKIMEDPK